PDEFIRSYRGMMLLFLQSHLEFQVVTPRNLDNFSGDLLILPDVKCLSRAELASLQMLMRSGKALMLTGETGKFDERRKAQPENPLHRMLGITDLCPKRGSRFIYDPECPGRTYYAALENDFNRSALRGDRQNAPFNRRREDFIKEISPALTS